MIEELHIRGLGVIEDATLTLGPGLTVVTGETGAGKTMLVTALQLLLGARASTDLVRSGHDAAIIEAVLRVPDGATARGDTTGQEDPTGTGDGEAATPEGPDPDDVAALWDLAEDGVLIVAREIPTSGRSRARVGGRLVPSSSLAALLAPHVEVHGQHEHVRLERPAVQRRLLDAFGGPEHRALLEAHRSAHAAWAAAEARVRRLHEGVEERARRLERLQAERDEIDAAALDPERDASLDQDIDRLANADALREAIDSARAAAGAGGALDGLGAAVAALRRSPVDDTALRELGERLEATSRELSEVVADLAALAADVEADDVRLDLLQQRKRTLTALERRYGAGIDAVLAHRAEVGREIEELETLEADADGVEAHARAAHEAALASAARLTASRRTVGARLVDAVGTHLAELGLAQAGLEVTLEPLGTPQQDGMDRVELLLAANPGEPAARLADAASGGERSRVALALEVVLSDAQGHGVLVFDEVDAGIGGSTALAVGDKLGRLASGPDGGRQVLCVTHLAQVAASADAHHVVEKSVRGGRTVTTVRRVEESERAEVLSRMLGGEATAEAGLEHARGLLEAARVARAG